jgi:hypothetical protein
MKVLDNVRLLLHSVAFAIAGIVLAYIVHGGPMESGSEIVKQLSPIERELLQRAMWFYAANGIWIGWIVGCLTLIAQRVSESKSAPAH